MMYDNEVKYPLTIEKQLERYYKSEGHTERHEVLWHTWNQNRRWITQLLQITLCSYPTYSKHDETHAQTVLHNIEMILGEDRIADLSASDCFILLHTVYIHDIGMCITHKDREEILQNRAFIDMITELEGYEESSLYQAIKALRKTQYTYEDEEDEIKVAQRLYADKLEVYYALIQLIGDFRRREHGEKAKERLYNWVKNPNELGGGFSLAGMPQRIFLTIANCARMHTQPDFDAIMELPQEDDGYVSDYIHPRFISVLLQLGDILDMDNNRFHPLMQTCMASVPETSQQHYDKHMSIRKLHIRPDKIEIEADCDSQEALRLVRKECDMLKSILKDAGYSWAVICPPGYKGSLPTVESVNLFMKGRKIPEELVTTQFKISQQKAFNILEGANLYSGSFVFIREFLQNAVDATKIQYWNDCVSTSEYYKNKGIKKDTPYQLETYVSTDNYPIEIEMEIQKKNSEGISRVTQEDVDVLDSEKESHCIYGVKIQIKDFGTGIDKDRILNISKVGSSRKKDRNIIESMPAWLRPTAEFGIGLQSAFLLVGSFSCYTHTRSGERYEITFGSGSSVRYDGYINVKPIDSSEALEDDTFGTCFEIFVPCSKKNLHQDCLKAWNGEDPFSEEYERRRPLRHAAELAAQMAIYLNGLVGELLFPLHLNLIESGFVNIPVGENIENIQTDWWKIDKRGERRKITKNDEGHKKFETQEDRSIRPWIKDKKSWIFYKKDVEKDDTIIREEVENDIFLLDCRSARLHIWSGNTNAFVTISAKNLFKREELAESYEDEKSISGVKIYYKGIELQTNQLLEDNDFIEYVDIKGDLDRSLLNLSRKGFTEKGNKYFLETINGGLQKSIQNVLKFLKKDKRKRVCKIADEIEKRCVGIGKELNNKDQRQLDKKVRDLMLQIMSAVVLFYLSRRNEYNLITAYGNDAAKEEDNSEEEKKIKNPFDELIRNIVSFLSSAEYNDINKTINMIRKKSLFFNFRVYNTNLMSSGQQDNINMATFFDPNNRFAVLQIRESIMDTWNSYLIKIDSGDSICEELEKLVFARKKDRNNEKIDVWREDLIKNLRGNLKCDENHFRQQFLVNWIIRNVPTIAILSDSTGNIRVNVLSSSIYPFIYLNENFKILILKRMVENYKKNGRERFSTIAWQKREFLACDKVPFSAYFIKRGMLQKQSYYKVIVPVRGKCLYKLQQESEKTPKLNYVKNMRRTLEEINMRKYLQILVAQDENTEEYKEFYENQEFEKYQDLIPRLKKEMQEYNLLLNINEFYMDIILSNTGENSDQLNKLSFDEAEQLLDKNEKRLKQWHKLFWMVVQSYFLMRGEEEKAQEIAHEISDVQEFKSLCAVVNFFRAGIWKELLGKKIYENLFSQMETDPNKGRILKYIQSNSKYPISAENIEICYNDFEKEIFSLFETVARNTVEPGIEGAIKMMKIEKVDESNERGENKDE